jgi:hypothetical protein
MRKAVIKIELEYEFPDSMSDADIEEAMENQELPEKYKEDSFELIEIVDSGTNQQIHPIMRNYLEPFIKGGR